MKKSLFLTQCAIIAALYVVLTYVSDIFGLASNAIQFRISEALTILPLFTFSAVPGLTVGCLISNVFMGVNPLDMVFGTLATFIGAVGAWYIKKLVSEKKALYIAPVFPIIANVIIVPLVLKYQYPADSLWYFMWTVFVGEFVCCGIGGVMLGKALERTKIFQSEGKG